MHHCFSRPHLRGVLYDVSPLPSPGRRASGSPTLCRWHRVVTCSGCVSVHGGLVPRLPYPSLSRWTAGLHLLALADGAAVNAAARVSFGIVFFSRYVLLSGVAGSYGGSVFSCLRASALLDSGRTSLHFRQQCRRFRSLHVLACVYSLWI